MKTINIVLSEDTSKNVTRGKTITPKVIKSLEYGDELDNNQIFVAVRWFEQVGIVVTFDSCRRIYKSYVAPIISGNSEIDDIQHIASYGSKFPIESAVILFPFINFNLDVIDVMVEDTKEIKRI